MLIFTHLIRARSWTVACTTGSWHRSGGAPWRRGSSRRGSSSPSWRSSRSPRSRGSPSWRPRGGTLLGKARRRGRPSRAGVLPRGYVARLSRIRGGLPRGRGGLPPADRAGPRPPRLGVGAVPHADRAQEGQRRAPHRVAASGPPPVGPLAIIGETGSPWTAVPGLVLVAAAAVVFAARRLERSEILYGESSRCPTPQTSRRRTPSARGSSSPGSRP